MDTYHNLDIIAYDDRTQKHPTGNALPEWLPKHEFLMLIVAPAGSGKTTVLLNILLRIYKAYWNEIFIFTPTIHNDSKWEHIYETKGLLLPLPNKTSKQYHTKRLNKLRKWRKEHNEQNTNNDTRQSDEEDAEREFEYKIPNKYQITLAPRSKGTTSFLKAKKQRLSKDHKEHLKKTQTQKHTIYRINEEVAKGALIDHFERRQLIANKLLTPLPPDRAKILKDYKHSILKMSLIQEPHTQPFTKKELHGLLDDKNESTGDSSTEEETQTLYTTKAKDTISEDHTFEEASDEIIEFLIKRQDRTVEHFKRIHKPLTTHVPRTLWVFDDMVGSGLFNQKRNNAFKRLTVRRRHLFSSIIGVTQAYKEIPKTTRTNANALIIFRIDSDEELMAIYQEYPMGLKWRQWERMMKELTAEPYSFVLFNLQTSNPKQRIVQNFTTPIDPQQWSRNTTTEQLEAF